MAKPQSLKKQDILDRWDGLEPSQPIKLQPLDPKHKGSTYAEDALRITGSQEWIDSVLSRLKDLLEYDGNGSRLNPIYTQTTTRYKNEEGKLVSGDLTGSYAFYFKCVSRGSGVRGRKKGGTNRPKEEQEAKPEKVKNPLKEVNAGLKIREKMRAEKKGEPVKVAKQTAPAYTDPLYAIASSFLDDNGKIDPVWMEPIEHPVFPCQTYDDVCTFDDAIEEIMKKYKIKRKDIHKVEINVQKNGTLKFEEF